MDIQKLRDQTPGCQERIHLNNAGSALMPEPVVRAIQEHITLESRMGGYEAADKRSDEIQAAYRAVAELIGTSARNIAFTENATVSYMQALSSIDFKPNDVLLTTNNDYVSNQIQFLSLQRRFGIDIVRAPDRPEGGVDVTAVPELVRRHRPRLVCVTHVPTNSGLVQNVRAVGEICRSEDCLFLVDACQSVGQIPIDVSELGSDFLSATSRKFLRGPRGSGFLYVSDRVLERGLEPLFIDLRGADWIARDEYRAAADARRFENWEFCWSLVLGTGEAARYAQNIGVEKICDRVRALADRLRDGLGAIDQVQVLDRGPELCGIVSVWIGDRQPADIVSALRKRGINTSAQIRSYAVIDYDRKQVPGSVRFSPHYYNTEDEIDRAVSAMRDVLSY